MQQAEVGVARVAAADATLYRIKSKKYGAAPKVLLTFSETVGLVAICDLQ